MLFLYRLLVQQYSVPGTGGTFIHVVCKIFGMKGLKPTPCFVTGIFYDVPIQWEVREIFTSMRRAPPKKRKRRTTPPKIRRETQPERCDRRGKYGNSMFLDTDFHLVLEHPPLCSENIVVSWSFKYDESSSVPGTRFFLQFSFLLFLNALAVHFSVLSEDTAV